MINSDKILISAAIETLACYEARGLHVIDFTRSMEIYIDGISFFSDAVRSDLRGNLGVFHEVSAFCNDGGCVSSEMLPHEAMRVSFLNLQKIFSNFQSIVRAGERSEDVIP